MKYGAAKYGQVKYGISATGGSTTSVAFGSEGRYLAVRKHSSSTAIKVGSLSAGKKSILSTSNTTININELGIGSKRLLGNATTIVMIIAKGAYIRYEGIVLGDIGIIERRTSQSVTPMNATIITVEPDIAGYTGKISVTGRIGISEIKPLGAVITVK